MTAIIILNKHKIDIKKEFVMFLPKMRKVLIKRIDGKMEFIRKETSYLLESIIDIRASMNEVSYLKFLENYLDKIDDYEDCQ